VSESVHTKNVGPLVLDALYDGPHLPLHRLPPGRETNYPNTPVGRVRYTLDVAVFLEIIHKVRRGLFGYLGLPSQLGEAEASLAARRSEDPKVSPTDIRIAGQRQFKLKTAHDRPKGVSQ
jgi:hypothetical protein